MPEPATDPSTVRLLLVDDHTLLREAMRDLLLAEPGFDVVGEAGEACSAVRLAQRLRPDVVLLDVDMPGNRPAMTVHELFRVSPGVKVLIVSMYDEPTLVQEMLRIGVAGYLHKSVGAHDLYAAVRAAVSRSSLVTVAVPRGALAHKATEEAGVLSDREREVLALVARALSNRQIAARLSITEGTVKRHLRNIFDKLGAVSRLDAVNRAAASSLL